MLEGVVMLAPASTLGNGSREAWADLLCGWTRLLLCKPLQRMLLLLSLPTQPFHHQNPAPRTFLCCANYLLSAGLGLLQLGRGLEGIPTGIGET